MAMFNSFLYVYQRVRGPNFHPNCGCGAPLTRPGGHREAPGEHLTCEATGPMASKHFSEGELNMLGIYGKYMGNIYIIIYNYIYNYIYIIYYIYVLVNIFGKSLYSHVFLRGAYENMMINLWI